MKLNYKLNRYWQYPYELQKKYDLTESETVLFAFLYNHCINLNDAGYCGYSNEKISELTRQPLRTMQRNLKNLKDKKMIIIENPGKRTRIKGKSRMIYINDNIFVKEIQTDLFDQQEEINQLREKIKELEQKTKKNDLIIDYLIDYGMIEKKESERASEELLPIYKAIIKADNYSFTRLQRHLSYVKRVKDPKITDNISYLKRCALNYLNRLKNNVVQ